MVEIDINKCIYDAKAKELHISEKDVEFATIYSVVNPVTGVTVIFEFTHSTGPEFDPNTDWVYESTSFHGNKPRSEATALNLKLIVHYDVSKTRAAANAYLEAKMRK